MAPGIMLVRPPKGEREGRWLDGLGGRLKDWGGGRGGERRKEGRGRFVELRGVRGRGRERGRASLRRVRMVVPTY